MTIGPLVLGDMGSNQIFLFLIGRKSKIHLLQTPRWCYLEQPRRQIQTNNIVASLVWVLAQHGGPCETGQVLLAGVPGGFKKKKKKKNKKKKHQP